MKAIILGAGASHDWVNSFDNNLLSSIFSKYRISENECESIKKDFWNYEWRPPLTKEIFSRSTFISILNRYNRANVIKSEMIGRDNLEELFQQLLKRCGIDRPRNDELMKIIVESKFYLRALFAKISAECIKKGGASNYSRLISKADEWSLNNNEPIIYITFNYDTILDAELSRYFNHDFNSIEDYFSNQRFKLFKPHGSCNWHKRVEVDKSDNNKTCNASVIINNNILPLSTYNVLDEKVIVQTIPEFSDVLNLEKPSEPRLLMIPRISIPLAAKDGFQLPQTKVNEMGKYISHLDEILIIGWRATEEHFTNLLRKHIREREIKITIVDTMPETAIENLRLKLPSVEFNSFPRKGIYISTFEGKVPSNSVLHKPGSFSDFIINNNSLFSTERRMVDSTLYV